jgi:teichuronic acid exporter
MSEQGDGMSVLEGGESIAVAAAPRRKREFETRGVSVRAFAARGMMINAAFDVALQGLSLLRGFALAALLTRTDYGVWGVLGVSLGVLARIKIIGVGDKYVQQEDDTEEAFQHAFTMEAIVTWLSMIPLLIALPIVGLVYGHWKVVPPGAALLLALPAQPFVAALWVYMRRMEFASVRMLQSLDPVTSFVVTVLLALLGCGYWSFVGGLLAGQWAVAIGCIIRSPFRFRWRYDRSTMRVYSRFTMPLFLSSLASIILANTASLAINAKLGLAGVGVVGLTTSITAFSTNVDDIVSGTIYPAICAVNDRVDLLRESFQKVNRLALMWAMPFGIGLALFCGDLVRYGFGPRWEPAVSLLQITGVVVAIGHIGFNWDDYLRARGQTKPVGTAAIVTAFSFVVVGLPLTLAYGLRGLGFGIAVQSLANLALRAYYLRRLFPGFMFVRHGLRATATVVPAAALILAIRLLAPGHDTLPVAVGELSLFLVVYAVTTYAIEGRLVREALGYMMERRRRAAVA